MDDGFDFDYPWRPVYEWKMAGAWFGAAFLGFLVTKTLPVPTRFGAITTLMCSSFGLFRAFQAWSRSLMAARLRLADKGFIDVETLIAKSRRALRKSSLWLGSGFQWTDIEASRMHALLGKGIASQMGRKLIHQEGAFWLHGLSREEDLMVDLANLVGHTLIVGTTRVGKTRLLDLLVAQAIYRGEPVIIIDPKGDHGLAQNAKRLCDVLGQRDRFVYFHPAHPESSACIDPLRNWNRRTELASRIAALIPSETGADPFTAFGWKVLNDIVNGLIASGIRPNLVQLRRYIEGGPDELLLRAFKVHFKRHVRDWESRSSSFVKQHRGNLLAAYIAFYRDVVIHEHASVDLAGLISTFEHNREHFQKMVASLIPILSMLTSEPLAGLLSPDLEPGHERVVTDMAQAIRSEKVLYVGLDSLADATVGSAIGSVLLADLAAVAGDRYNYGIDSLKPVNLFIDEAAEVINQPTIQLMNKGGGAQFRVTIATQTFADFASRLGDENKARQVLANTNSKIALRVLDAETQRYIADGIPKIRARSMVVRYGHSVDSRIQDEYSASYQEQTTDEEADLIPPAILGELPPLHFFARLSGGRTIKGRLPILR